MWESSRSFFVNPRKNSQCPAGSRSESRDLPHFTFSQVPESSELGPLQWYLQPVSHCDSLHGELPDLSDSHFLKEHLASSLQEGSGRTQGASASPSLHNDPLQREACSLHPSGVGTHLTAFKGDEEKMSLEKAKRFPHPNIRETFKPWQPMVLSQTNFQRSQTTPIGNGHSFITEARERKLEASAKHSWYHSENS